MSSGGIEGKWNALVEERDELREANKTILTELEELRAWRDRVANADTTALIAERDALSAQLSALQGSQGRDVLHLDATEREAMDALLKAYTLISETWGLKANSHELTAAVHTVQGFIVQHMISRLSPDWASWWQKET